MQTNLKQTIQSYQYELTKVKDALETKCIIDELT